MWPHVVAEVLDGEGNVVQRYEPCVLWDIADGVLMEDPNEIAANCESLDPELRADLIANHSVSPEACSFYFSLVEGGKDFPHQRLQAFSRRRR